MENKINIFAVIISIAMLLLSIPPLFPYGFYILLRWVVCVTAVYLACLSKGLKKKGWMWTMIFIALLFNPFFLIHLGKVDRVLTDTVVACLFIASLIKFKKEKKESILNTKLVKAVAVILFFAVIISVISYCYFLITQKPAP